MISRRNFLSAAPIGMIAAPSIVQALPSPMPIVDAGVMPIPYQYLGADNPKTLSRIWHHMSVMTKTFEGKILASDMKNRMEEIAQMVTGHKPPFILHSYAENRNDFIFHTIADKIKCNNFVGPILNQPCYRIEWCPELYSEVFPPDWKGYPETGYVEYMACFSFREEGRVIYDL